MMIGLMREIINEDHPILNAAIIADVDILLIRKKTGPEAGFYSPAPRLEAPAKIQKGSVVQAGSTA